MCRLGPELRLGPYQRQWYLHRTAHMHIILHTCTSYCTHAHVMRSSLPRPAQLTCQSTFRSRPQPQGRRPDRCWSVGGRADRELFITESGLVRTGCEWFDIGAHGYTGIATGWYCRSARQVNGVRHTAAWLGDAAQRVHLGALLGRQCEGLAEFKQRRLPPGSLF